MGAPELWLIAGPNGAGKTTSMSAPRVQAMMRSVRYFNADDRTREKLLDEGWSGFAAVPLERLTELFIAAAEEVFVELCDAIEHGKSVGTETVLSTHKYRSVVERVHELGGTFKLLYVGLRHPSISVQRVAQRVREGGHDVPTDRLEARWQRSIEHLGWYARQAEQFFVFDNSTSLHAVPPLIAEGGAGVLRVHEPDAIPEITASLTVAFSTPH